MHFTSVYCSCNSAKDKRSSRKALTFSQIIIALLKVKDIVANFPDTFSAPLLCAHFMSFVSSREGRTQALVSKLIKLTYKI